MQELVDVHARASSAAGRADRLTAFGLGIGYVVVALAAAVAWALRTPHLDVLDLALAAPLVALYVVAYRTEFVATSGSSVPTEPVLVGMLLLLPLPLVPLVVLASLQFGGTGALRSGGKVEALLVQWTAGWHCLGPVAVLWAAGDPPVSLGHGGTYLLALLSQFVVDGAVAMVRTRSLGVPVRRLVHPLAWTFATDSLLAPVGLCTVVAGGRSLWTVAMLGAPVALVRLLARDRTEHLETAVSLSTALSVVHEEARVDALTGLANRRAWDEAIEAAQQRRSAGGQLTATVIAADLDGLKAVNDRLGHEAGDALLVAMASSLRQALPSATAIARVGGDEFAALLETEGPAPDAHQISRSIRAAAAQYRGTDDVRLSASIGACCSPPEPTVHEAALAADRQPRRTRSRVAPDAADPSAGRAGCGRAGRERAGRERAGRERAGL